MASKKYFRKYRKDNPDKIKAISKKHAEKHPERLKETKRNWNKKNLKKKAKLAKEYRKRYPEKIKARALSSKIKIPLGEKCELCKVKLAQERHHPDYNSPLEVMFLCVECHRRLHFGRK